MVDVTITAIVGGLSAIASLVLLNALRKTIARSEWGRTALFGALSVMLFSLVYLVVTYSDAWVKITKQNQDLWLVPRWGRYLIMVLSVLLVAVASTTLLQAVRRKVAFNVFNPAAVLALALVVISCLSTIINGDNPIRPATAVFVVVVAACTVAPRGVGIHVGIGTCCVIAAIASGFAIAVHKDFSVVPCVGDKCGILDFNFRGIFHHENAFAMFLALAMPFVYIAFASWEGPLLAAYLLGLILLAGSRTSSAAAVLTFVVLILVRPNIRRAAWAPVRTVLLYLLLALAFVVGLALPFFTNDATFLNDRGHMWMLARDQLSDPPTFAIGTGMLGWQHVRDSALVHISSGYAVHNQWLHVLYTTGLVGLLLFVAVMVVLIWRAGRTYSLVIGCVLLPVFVLAVTERPWPIDSADWVMWVVPGALLSYPAAKRLSADSSAQTSEIAEERHADAIAECEQEADVKLSHQGRHRAEGWLQQYLHRLRRAG
jgi:O-antigen ligase